MFRNSSLNLSYSQTANPPNNVSYVQWKYQDPPSFHPFWFETLDYDAWKQYMATNWVFSFYAAFCYLITIFSLKHFMKDRQKLNLQWTLVTWNFCLGIFSLMGFLRSGQELLSVLTMTDGVHKSICSRIGLNRPAAFYSVAFTLSKYIELGDTVFIVLRKQPLVFLQWYHHCTTLVMAWLVSPYSEPIFRWYGVMNYGVHSIMYPYFVLKVLKYRVPRKVSMLITTLQLLQMIVGVGINLYSVHIIRLYGPNSCARDPVSIKWTGGVYASFIILFAHFFYERYIVKRKTM